MDFFDDNTIKKIINTALVLLAVVVIALLIVFIGKSYFSGGNNEDLYSYEIKSGNDVTSDFNDLDYLKTSSSNDKNIEEVLISKENLKDEITNINENLKNDNKLIEEVNNAIEEDKKEEKNNNSAKGNLNENKKELKFEAPVAGEIIKDFAKDSLIYSKTLDEWTTHLGIDIKGDKTTVVKAAECGTVESIKNDPRYGLTIILKHDDGFKTVYSNLLTTEFVNEGDKVEKGQTIATIGDSASFEILDDSHLHFEIYKDEVSVNPTVYLR